MVEVEFARHASLLRETDRRSDLPIVRNGPPGTFVMFPDGLRVSLPTDQIVRAEDADGRVRVTFGGMRFEGPEAGQLVFVRVRELHAEELLSPDRSHTMRLNPSWVAAVIVEGRQAWAPTV